MTDYNFHDEKRRVLTQGLFTSAKFNLNVSIPIHTIGVSKGHAQIIHAANSGLSALLSHIRVINEGDYEQHQGRLISNTLTISNNSGSSGAGCFEGTL